VEIKALDQYCDRQEKQEVAGGCSIYPLQRIFHVKKAKEDDVEIEKSNVILVGETGYRKTLLARTIRRMLMFLLHCRCYV